MANGLSREAEISIAKMRKAWVNDLPKVIRDEMRRTVVDAAEDLAQRMRNTVAIDQGDVRDSITVVASTDGLKAYIVAGDTGQSADVVTLPQPDGTQKKAFHAVFLEFGTKDHPAQPFFWPNWRLAQGPMKKAFARAFRNAFRRLERRNG